MKLVKVADDAWVSADEVLYLLAEGETHTQIVFRNKQVLTVPTLATYLARKFPQ